MLSWTDPEKLAGGYGTRTPVDIIKAPATMAYIMLIAVKGAKNKYDDEEVNLYTMFHSEVKKYVRIHGEDTFFSSTTRNTFALARKKETNTNLLLLVELPDIDPFTYWARNFLICLLVSAPAWGIL